MSTSFWEGFFGARVGQKTTKTYQKTQTAEAANVSSTTIPPSRPGQCVPITQHVQTLLHEQTPLHASTAQHVPTGPLAQPLPSSSTPMAPPPAKISPRPFTRPIPENIRISRPAFLPHQPLPETSNATNPQTGVPSQPQTTTGSEAPLLGPGAERKEKLSGPWRASRLSFQENSTDISHGIKHRMDSDQNAKKRKQGEPSSVEEEEEWHELTIPAYDREEPRSLDNMERELRLREENLEKGYRKKKFLLGAISRLENSINVEESMIASIKKEMPDRPE